MKIIIIGAGEVGKSIARALSSDHDTIVIEKERKRLEALKGLDVLALPGNGAHLKVLQDAGAVGSDLFIACTNVDEVNILACGAGKQLGAAFTIARVHDADYLENWQPGQLGVDSMVCSEVLTSEAISRVIGLSEAIDTKEFADGQILMTELLVSENSPLIGLTIKDAGIPDSCNIASLIRDGTVIIPTGNDVILAGDRIVNIGTPEAVKQFNARLGGYEALKDVVIIGGGRIGFRLAQLLQHKDLRIRMIEADEERSRFLAENLTRCQVFQSDGTDLEFLEREKIGSADVAVSVMNKDERNLLAALLLKKLGVKKVIAGVEDPSYVHIFEMVGIDVAVNPRKVLAEEIIKFTKARTEAVSILEQDRAEVLEKRVSKNSPLIGKTLKDTPPWLIVGAIVRKNNIIIPRGSDSIKAGDKVIVFCTKDKLKELETLL